MFLKSRTGHIYTPGIKVCCAKHTLYTIGESREMFFLLGAGLREIMLLNYIVLMGSLSESRSFRSHHR